MCSSWRCARCKRRPTPRGCARGSGPPRGRSRRVREPCRAATVRGLRALRGFALVHAGQDLGVPGQVRRQPGRAVEVRPQELVHGQVAVLRQRVRPQTGAAEADFAQLGLLEVRFRGTDLAGADFREADLSGGALRGADLSGADFREANLRHADFTVHGAGPPGGSRCRAGPRARGAGSAPGGRRSR
ncbi:pentapeptide repeat-containing protein [Streptomyces sp. NPDC017529]|uniref:pentapeptide repeat-containing protein n=1 Tax=Streptomyces sp. NPDC017529 TaxID=3365000 RepID=UPI0037A3D69B